MARRPLIALPNDSQAADASLATAFFEATGPHTAALCGLNDHVLMANPRAASCLLAADHATLWNKIRREISGATPFVTQLDVRGKLVIILCTPVLSDGVLTGALLDFNPATGDTAPVPDDVRSVIPGSSLAATLAQNQLTRELGSTGGTLISGAKGSGKTQAAKYLLAAGFPGREFAIFDAARHSVDALEDVVERGNALVLLHAETFSAEESARVASLLNRLVFEVPVLVTCSDHRYDGPIARMLLGRIHLPSLAERMEDLPQIANRLLRRIPGREYRLAPAARKLLLSYSWPGNLAELSSTLEAAAVASASRVISEQCIQLPRHVALRTRSTGSLKSDERHTILMALSRANGNKLIAADLLGIARSTLYKKLDALGDVPPVAHDRSGHAA